MHVMTTYWRKNSGWVQLTECGIFLDKEVVSSKPTHVDNKILRQFCDTVSHPCCIRPDNFSHSFSIKLLEYVEKWNLHIFIKMTS